ncbi:MAG: spore germination protein [Bacilli bacterium]|nr:spore germination protein [Bacilli bacterium]
MYQSLINQLKTSDDVLAYNITIQNEPILIIFNKDLADIDEFNKFYYDKLCLNIKNNLLNVFPYLINVIDNDLDTMKKSMLNGFIVIKTPTLTYEFLLPKANSRTITSSVIDPVDLYSSQDGFIENMDINIALVRKHLRDKNLNVEIVDLPTKCNNKVAILNLDNKINQKIKDKLSTINVINVNSINTISKAFQKKHLLPLTLSTSSPQNVSTSISKGKTAIILNNSPVACIIPVNFLYFSTMKNDVDTPIYYSILSRTLVLLFMFIAVFLLGLYVAITNFHSSSLTIYALSNLKLTERGTTLPMLSEILIVLLLFDLYRYATSRSSNGYIQNIIIFLGGLFIGQNAIKSGLIGHLILLITSISYLATYAFTNNLHMVTTLSIFRIIIIICSYIFGLFGFLVSSIFIIYYLLSIKTFNEDFFLSLRPRKFKQNINYFMPKEQKNEKNI